MTFEFSTRNVHPRERLACWRETMSVVSHEFDASSGTEFVGTVRSEFLDEVIVSDFECDACEVKRTARNIRFDDCDDFLLCMQLTGEAVISQDDRQAVIQNGSFALIDPRRPFSVSYQTWGRSVSLKLPRQAFEARLGGASMLSAYSMTPDRPLTGLASGFLSMLPSRVEMLDGAARARIGEQSLDLIAMAMSREADQAGATLSSPRAVALLSLKTVIESRLSDPTLRPAIAAHAAGISVRYANALLAQEDTSLERYILNRRLDRCRQALSDPHQSQRLIGDIAFCWGFSDLSHFTRRFKAAFGLSPRDYRQWCLDRKAETSGTTNETGSN